MVQVLHCRQSNQIFTIDWSGSIDAKAFHGDHPHRWMVFWGERSASKKSETGSDGSQLRLNKKWCGGCEEERGMEGSWPVLQIYVEPFKLFTKSESAVAKSQYQEPFALRQKSARGGTQTAYPSLARGWGGSSGGYEIFVSGEGLSGL